MSNLNMNMKTRSYTLSMNDFKHDLQFTVK